MVVLDLDAGTEGRLEGGTVGGGDRTPTDGVQEGVQPDRGIEAVGVGGGRQVAALMDPGTDLQFPEHLDPVVGGIIADAHQGDHVLGLAGDPGSVAGDDG